jgi:sialate O-acetylesterase
VQLFPKKDYMKLKIIIASALVIHTMLAVVCTADVKLPPVFADHMILQQNQKLPVWGTADPEEKVTVKFAGQIAEVTADKNGYWKVILAPVSAKDAQIMTIKGKNTVTLNDILLGEVWLCSGQSNMAFLLSQAKNAKQEIAEANYPEIRQFTVFRKVSGQPDRSLTGKWTICTPDKAGQLSAVGYFFAREIYKELKVPVGILCAAVGDTPGAAWTPMEIMDKNPELNPILQRFKQDCIGSEEKMKAFQKAQAELKIAIKEAEASGKKPPRGIKEPMNEMNFRRPGGLFNGMIYPLAPYAMRGVLWYQGENDCALSGEYRHLLPAMISSWRELWGQGDFPFYIVQLPNYGREKTDQNQFGGWPELRAVQAATAVKLPNCGLAVTIDIGDAENIHPVNKQDVGKRLSLLALAKDYNKKDVVCSGPVFKSMNAEGGTLCLSFDSVGGGLIVKGEALKGFAIAGSDNKYYWADAKIQGDTVVVSSGKVNNPVTVRYACGDNPSCNLYNKAGLPAVPFNAILK